MHSGNYRKKLIEIALPLEAINKACAREKSIRHGHPSTLHLWWARRPLAAARAVIFAQMVDDPSAYVDVLGADPKLRRKADTALKARLKLWEEARTLAEKAKGSGLPVPEPGPAPTLDDMLADLERQRLFLIIEDLVLWENTTNETVLQAARDEIWQSWRRACAENADHPRAKELFDRKKLPAFHDPFAGGGALPLEAQRLGLESYASDLNPVAVLINKAMIEIPPKFAGKPPVNPAARSEKSLDPRQWRGAQGLADDVRYYGQWMRDEAEKRIGHLYPKIEVTADLAKERPDLKALEGRKLTVVAWLWARTVKSPNPAFAQVDVPLASTFMVSTKAGKESYIEPVIESSGYRFTVKVGSPQDADLAKNGTKLSRGANFRCLMSGVPISGDYIKAEGKAGRMGARLMAIVAEGARGRVYLPPTEAMEAVARLAKPEWIPETPIPPDKRSMFTPLYGLTQFHHLFSSRQLVALTTFSGLVQEARERVKHDALAAGIPDDGKPLASDGAGAIAYADAVGVYLAFAISKLADRGSTICTWFTERDSTRNTFARQTLPMTWDYAELNTLLDGTGSFVGAVDWTAESIEGVAAGYGSKFGASSQVDATSQSLSQDKIISTDPPYYDNIGYADLSDFFYIWLRRSLQPVFPDLFATLAVPKAEELVASPYRHGNKVMAESFFLDGMTHAMHRLAEQAHPAFPVTIYYAFKQAESDGADGTTNTGWDTFLAAVIEAGFAISGTWPMRTELGNRMIGSGTNALASSIVLVCRPRAADSPTATRREFVTALKAELPEALAHLQAGNIAPVDLAQAAIGPGMAVYTRYAKVLDAEGKALTVREALALINETLDEALAEQEGDFDADSRWALTWFEQSGFAEGEYGVAEQLSKSKNTSVAGMVGAGILESKRGKVRLLKPEELPADWDPTKDPRLTAWEIVHHLIRVLASGGEDAAAVLLANLGAKAETGRELCYRLYTLCERKKRAVEALAYNGLVQSWPEIARLAGEGGKPKYEQGALFADTEE
jgi:putative DNA methylase